MPLQAFTKRSPAHNPDPEYHSLCTPRVHFNWGFWDGRADQKRGAVLDVSSHFDPNHRDGYLAGVASAQSGGDIREFSRGAYGKGRAYMTRQAVDDAVFLHDHRWRIAKAVEACSDISILRQVAALVGYKAEE